MPPEECAERQSVWDSAIDPCDSVGFHTIHFSSTSLRTSTSKRWAIRSTWAKTPATSARKCRFDRARAQALVARLARPGEKGLGELPHLLVQLQHQPLIGPIDAVPRRVTHGYCLDVCSKHFEIDPCSLPARSDRARFTLEAPTRSSAAMSSNDLPSARICRANATRSGPITVGRQPRRPRAFAAAMPARVFSLICRRCICANAATI